jgi:hypothetical protein
MTGAGAAPYTRPTSEPIRAKTVLWAAERHNDGRIVGSARRTSSRCNRAERALWDHARARLGAGRSPVVHHALRPDGPAPTRVGDVLRCRPARASSAIAAGPPEDTKAGFIVGKLGSEAGAERMLEGAQAGGRPTDRGAAGQTSRVAVCGAASSAAARRNRVPPASHGWRGGDGVSRVQG